MIGHDAKAKQFDLIRCATKFKFADYFGTDIRVFEIRLLTGCTERHEEDMISGGVIKILEVNLFALSQVFCRHLLHLRLVRRTSPTYPIREISKARASSNIRVHSPPPWGCLIPALEIPIFPLDVKVQMDCKPFGLTLSRGYVIFDLFSERISRRDSSWS